MIYFSDTYYPELDIDKFGLILTARSITKRRISAIESGYSFCIDNDAFSGKFTKEGFTKILNLFSSHSRSCAFVSMPDVLGDSEATYDQFFVWQKFMQILYPQYKIAFVLQDNCYQIPVTADAYFLGGSTKYKMSQEAKKLVIDLKALNYYVHVGRVNSYKRFKYFYDLGVDSVDGTHVHYKPSVIIPEMTEWFERVKGFNKGENNV